MKASHGTYYLYATSAPDGFLAWSSDNLIDWKEVGYVYRSGPESWGHQNFWAPEVIEYKEKYYMHYTARWKKNDSLRIGVAVSESPVGPFVDVQNQPMFDFGYACIDANIFIDDDGKKYMYYSRDCSENIVDGCYESHIYGIELHDDLVSLKSDPVLLTKPEQKWEKKSGPDRLWNEGPFVLKRNDLYYLMYSANCFADKEYAVGYATSENPLGPFTKFADNPILEYVDIDNEEVIVSGPGHNSITVSPDGSELYIVYHTHSNPLKGGEDRQVFIDRMGFNEDGSLFVNGPTFSEQPIPSSKEGANGC
ncbi:glycoside hydrolase family 43 protein [Lederbergia sp. NSJ-179]|nr:glycoside hydrolase family 43 protein [Lederbergia sp. NSJ-179]